MAVADAVVPERAPAGDDLLEIGGKRFRSRLMLGTGKFDSTQVALAWLFVLTRYVHAFIHIGFNFVPFRFAAFRRNSQATRRPKRSALPYLSACVATARRAHRRGPARGKDRSLTRAFAPCNRPSAPWQ